MRPPGDAVDALQRCRQVTEVLTRLACYDRIDIGAPGAVATPTVPAAPVPPPTAPSTANFGLPAPAPVAPVEIGTLESSISGAFDGWQPQTRIKLANGQVWQVTDGSEGVYDLRDPKVRITRGSFGSYFMHIEGIKQSPKVRRIQ